LLTPLLFSWWLLAAQNRQPGDPDKEPAPRIAEGSQNSGAQESASPQSTYTEGSLIGASLYLRHCEACHEAGTLPYINRTVMKKMSAEYIVRSLTAGMMRKEAANLNAGEREAIAEYLTSRSVVKAGPVEMGRGRCSAAPQASFSGPSWNGWGVDLENSRFQSSPDSALKSEQVSSLQLKWAFGYSGNFAAYSQPTVAGSRVFVGSPLGLVYALDAETGCTYWTFQALGGVRGAITIGPDGVAYFGDTRANVYAVNGLTGKVIWQKQVDDHPLARVTASVKLHEGRLYFGVASREEWLSSSSRYECCTFRGSVVALNAKTGKQIWKTYTIPEPSRRTRKSVSGTQLYGPSGAGVWGSPTLDTKRQVLYVGTGDNYSEPATSHSDSIMAFDLKTGEIVWSRQLTSGDVFNGNCLQLDRPSCPEEPGPDFDFGASPVLRTLAGGERILIAGQKSGVVHGLDPDKKGEILWQTRVGKGGLLGGIQWGMAADSTAVYAAISDIALVAGPEGYQPDPKIGGGLHAVDLRTGKKLWSALPPAEGCKTPRCSPAQSSAVTAIPGAVFSTAEDGHIRAYSTKDGAILWDYNTLRSFDTVNQIPAHGGTMDGAGPAVAGGMLFVNSGYGFFYGASGNVLLAFAPK